MSARRTPHGFVWYTFWRKARRHATEREGPFPRQASANLSALEALGGVAPAAVACLRARRVGEGAWPRLDLMGWRAWRAHVLAGGSLSWSAWRKDWRARSVSMQALAAARREGAPLDSSLPEAAAAVLLRWKAGAR